MYRRLAVAALVAAMPAAGIAVRAVQAQNGCATLSALKLEDTTITSAEVVPGAVHPGRLGADHGAAGVLPRNAVTKPAVNFEVWLPPTGWNGKFQGVGNGGMAGVISYAAMARGAQARVRRRRAPTPVTSARDRSMHRGRWTVPN